MDECPLELALDALLGVNIVGALVFSNFDGGINLYLPMSIHD